MPPGPGMFSTTTRWLSFWLSLSARMRAVTSATPPAPNASTSLIGFSGQAACACGPGASTSAARIHGTILRVIISNSPALIARLLQILLVLFFLGRNHKAVPDCPPRAASAPADRAQIAGPDRPDRLHRPREWRSDAENRCPTTRALARLRPERARSAPLPCKAALKYARSRRP